MYFTDTIYYTNISKNSKIRQKHKNDPIVKRNMKQAGDIILDASMKFEKYPIKLLEKRHFTITIYYTIISKFQKFAKNSKMHKPGE